MVAHDKKRLASPMHVKKEEEGMAAESPSFSSNLIRTQWVSRTSIYDDDGKPLGIMNKARKFKEKKENDDSYQVPLTVYELMSHKSCHNGGWRRLGAEKCSCRPFFSGRFCDVHHCMNNGTLELQLGGKNACECSSPDFGGAHCELLHCRNGGEFELNNTDCYCSLRYSGRFCDDDRLRNGAPVISAVIILMIFLALWLTKKTFTPKEKRSSPTRFSERNLVRPRSVVTYTQQHTAPLIEMEELGHPSAPPLPTDEAPSAHLLPLPTYDEVSTAIDELPILPQSLPYVAPPNYTEI